MLLLQLQNEEGCILKKIVPTDNFLDLKQSSVGSVIVPFIPLSVQEGVPCGLLFRNLRKV